MRVLGVDPGLTRCGVGVVEGVPGRPCTLVAYYVIYTDPHDELPLRLLHLDRSLTELVAEHRPESVAVERVFSQHNVRTVMGTAQASGIAVLAGARAGLPVQTYTPSEVKAAVTGSGTADKAQMTAMVTRLLRLSEPPKMMSSIFVPLRLFDEISPRTQRIASEIFDFPLPLGPTITVVPPSKVSFVLSGKDLKP